MKKNLNALFLLFLFCSVQVFSHDYLTSKKVENVPPIRVATVNLMASRLSDLDLLASAVASLEADIIGMQEVDFKTNRSATNISTGVPVDQAEYIAEKAGMYVVKAPAIEYDGGEYGVALLSKFPVTHSETYELPNINDEEERIVSVSYLDVPGFPAPLGVIVTHPDSANDPELRLLQIRSLKGIISGVARKAIPIVIADLNALPISPEYDELMYIMNDTLPKEGNYTYPSWNPDRKIDYILTSKAQNWEVSNVVVPSPEKDYRGYNWGQVTDHLPIILDLKLLKQ